jgi:signal transduction histidine kinase
MAIHRQAMRAHEMISDLMLVARPPKLEKGQLELGQLVAQVVEEQADFAAENDVELITELGDGGTEVLGDETQLGVAVHALLKNAVEATAGGGQVRVAVRVVKSGEALAAELSVRDNGPGISDEIRPHIFDPFFSGREAGRGLGFGLSKCWRIVRDHGGQIIVNRPSSGGADFCIRLPLQPRS